jgi:succinyl-diaminopimelate desuccinylase
MRNLSAMVDKKRLIRTLKQLIAFDSQNPPGDERQIAGFVGGYLKNLGLGIKTYVFSDKRVNVVATLKSGKNKKSLLLTPHLDTVPAGKSWKRPPLTATIAGSRIYGLGTTDCKGNLACGLEAIQALVEDGVRLDYDLIFAATADEESGSGLGLIPLLERKLLRADAAVVLDADDFEIVITQKGLMHLTVRLRGKKAHGAYPWLGKNAIELAAKIILDLKNLRFRLHKNKYLHAPTVNVGTIKGGDKVNVVSDWCEFELDLRFLPGTRAQDILRTLKKIISRYTPHYQIQIQGIQDPYYIDPCHPLVSGLAKAMEGFKIKPRISGSEGATVITFFKKEHIPAIATGFGREGCAHIADEYADLDNLNKGARVLVEFLKNYRFNRF